MKNAWLCEECALLIGEHWNVEQVKTPVSLSGKKIEGKSCEHCHRKSKRLTKYYAIGSKR